MPKKITEKTGKKRAIISDLMPEEPPAFDDWKEPAVHNHYYHVDKKRTNFGKIALAVTLIMLGFIYLGVNLGWLPPDAKPDLWQLWPLLLVFLGLSLINGQGLLSLLAGGTLTLTIVTIVMLLLLNNVSLDQTDSTIMAPTVSRSSSTDIIFDKMSEAQRAEANISINGARLTVASSSGPLFYGNLDNTSPTFSSSSGLIGQNQIIDINLPAPLSGSLAQPSLSLNLGSDLNRLNLRAIASDSTLNSLSLPADTNLTIEGGQLTLNIASSTPVNTISLSGHDCQLMVNLAANHGLKLIGPAQLSTNSLQLSGKNNILTTPGFATTDGQTTIELDTNNCPITINQQ